ncbi:uncharacterized protein [Spinacia oleracea]|uniref:Retrotransposon Copia-like N-terminal domain-containing protein n=1 Tax=Spinacia oleracea TaxID=3562 RepID=A0ABM3RPG0_SPIOL|nr:uncharacterized protein LOC110803990 [Spinacia oleracea]
MAQTPLPPNQDPSSPFYLHPTNNTASQLVSVKFGGDGYGHLKRSMMISMSSKNKLDFVNGTLPKPNATHATYQAWLRCNDMMISWILFNLSPNVAKSVLYFGTAKEIWEDLEDMFGFVPRPQLYSLEQQATNITQECWLKKRDKEKTVNLWHTMRAMLLQQTGEDSMIIRTDELTTLTYHSIVRTTTHSLVASMPGGTRTGHKKPSSYFCDHCKVNGHSTERCFGLHGFPPGFTGFKTDKRAAAATYSDESFDDDMVEYQNQFYPNDREPSQTQPQPGFFTADQCS